MVAFFVAATITILIGITGGILYTKYIYPEIFGGIKIGIVVGISGSIIGGFVFDLLFNIPLLKKIQEIPYLSYIIVNPVDVNFIAVILGTWGFLSIYEYVSTHTERS